MAGAIQTRSTCRTCGKHKAKKSNETANTFLNRQFCDESCRRAEPVEQMFYAKVAKGSGLDACWLWTAGIDKDGYGQFMFQGKKQHAHRVAFFFANDCFPECGLHSCDVPACVRPDHIFDGTQTDNQADKTAKGRQARGERHGSAKLTEKAVLEILELASIGWTRRELAAQYGVTRSGIDGILRRRTWSYLVQEAA